jgi:hypothetical protein
MVSVVRLAVVALGLIVLSGCSQDEKPTAQQVEPSLRAYLIGEKARNCGGRVTVDRLSITNIGDYDDKMGGWPIYATFGVTCVEGSNFSTWNSDDTSSTSMASVVRKKLSGEYECFMPEIFREKENQMQKQMDLLPTDVAPKK